MNRKTLALLVLILLSLVTSPGLTWVTAANMRSFIEGVRRKATVVYVGSIREVRLLARTKFDIKARALIEVSAVMRGSARNPGEASLEYSSYDDKTPMLEGGPQYQLKPGVKVVVFADSFESAIPPGYLLQGNREELLHRVETLHDVLSHMSPDQLKVNEINEDDRRTQLALYKNLSACLRTSK